jgi:hypothetical protein
MKLMIGLEVEYQTIDASSRATVHTLFFIACESYITGIRILAAVSLLFKVLEKK